MQEETNSLIKLYKQLTIMMKNSNSYVFSSQCQLFNFFSAIKVNQDENQPRL